jgi:uncharacterized protein YlxP (DUF503 family)
LPYVALIEIHLHFPENGSLKGKRKELLSLKSRLQRRFGASVSETDHHDLWQRSTVTASLVGRDAVPLQLAADDLQRYVELQFPDGVRFERGIVSVDEVLGE